ncbi:MAG: alternative ribosome rescue aminoacyl-tRNA hydrolase ArfB [Bacteroidales bacterium]
MEDIGFIIQSVLKEVKFSTSRSSGPGGQNVNKVNTRVELRFHIPASKFLSADQKDLLFMKLKNKINIEGDLILTSQEERTQLRNKELVIEKFINLIEKALIKPKKRKTVTISKAAKEKRQEEKKNISENKYLRKPPEY